MSHRILVVEDEIDIQGYCKTVLEAAGFAVDACRTAAEARKLFIDHRPDLAVLDIGLPDGSGLDLMREWHSYPGPKLVVIFLTARGDLNTRLECFRLGGQDYVHKPFAAEELLARVKVHLQVRKSHEDLIKRNYELELVGRARQDMTDMIVHDLKAPLTAIKGTIELVRAKGLISEKGHAALLGHADSAADFMLLMLNDLLDVGQAQHAGLRAELGVVDLPALFEKLRQLFAGKFERRPARLDLAYASGVEKVRSDQKLLFRVLVNLISNALSVTPNRGEVQVEASLASDGSVRFKVLDRGPGVREADKARIFEKWSSGTARSLDTGTGIGLSFCRVAAEALRGRVWVEDREGGGSRFVFEHPQASA